MRDSAFENAADAFADTVNAIPQGAWERTGLGAWTVRELVGHTSRSFTTVAAGLDPQATTTSPDLVDAVAYYRWVSNQNTDPEAVVERGRHAADGLGSDPAAVVADLSCRVQALVREAGADRVVTTLGGSMTLAAYLDTRTFELTMHTLDLTRALDLPVPHELAEPIDTCARLAAELALRAGHGTDLLLALGGRRPLDPGLSVMI